MVVVTVDDHAVRKSRRHGSSRCRRASGRLTVKEPSAALRADRPGGVDPPRRYVERRVDRPRGSGQGTRSRSPCRSRSSSTSPRKGRPWRSARGGGSGRADRARARRPAPSTCGTRPSRAAPRPRRRQLAGGLARPRLGPQHGQVRLDPLPVRHRHAWTVPRSVRAGDAGDRAGGRSADGRHADRRTESRARCPTARPAPWSSSRSPAPRTRRSSSSGTATRRGSMSSATG